MFTGCAPYPTGGSGAVWLKRPWVAVPGRKADKSTKVQRLNGVRKALIGTVAASASYWPMRSVGSMRGSAKLLGCIVSRGCWRGDSPVRQSEWLKIKLRAKNGKVLLLTSFYQEDPVRRPFEK